MAIDDSDVTITISFVGSPGTDTSYTISRSVNGAAGPFLTLGVNVPLLGERALFTDTTAPIGVPLTYRAVGDQSGTVLLGVDIGTLPDTGEVWLKDPLRPWADLSFDFCDTTEGHHAPECSEPNPAFVWAGFGQQTWQVDAGLFPILNAERPADIYARRKFADGTLTFFTRTLDAIDRIYDLFTAGGVLFLQLPTVYGWDDAFIQPGDVTQSYISRDQRRPDRFWSVPFTIVDQPIGPIQGTECANWCAVEESFATFADLTASPGTWLDLLRGDVLCPPGLDDGFGAGLFGDGPFGDGG